MCTKRDTQHTYDMLQHSVTLQPAATHCNMTRNMPATCLQLFDNDRTLQHACNTPQHTATVSHINDTHDTPSRPIHVPASQCTTLQRTVKDCNTLQRTATNCNTLQHTLETDSYIIHVVMTRTTRPHDKFMHLQHTATHTTHCNTHQHTATNHDTIQRIATH